ncbi:MAG: cupredoxin domain-containing protein [Gammaproteobacteria bacterium]|nr:cupredoxin domain-containing protein [Gammaproteobacteria bacterium]
MRFMTLIVSGTLITAMAGLAHAETPVYQLVIKNHRFEPNSLTVPAGQKFRLVVENQDPTPEEFESHTLNREKIVPGNGRITLNLGPLDAGSYSFFGEFNPKTATGKLIVR